MKWFKEKDIDEYVKNIDSDAFRVIVAYRDEDDFEQLDFAIYDCMEHLFLSREGVIINPIKWIPDFLHDSAFSQSMEINIPC